MSIDPQMLPDTGTLALVGARLPACLLAEGGDADALIDGVLTIERGLITAVLPQGAPVPDGLPTVDLDGGLVLPGLVDIHTHLDKGHILPRAPNPDGTFFGALEAVAADREAHWSPADLRRRMDFGLRCAFAHGTVAIRTHLDSIGKQTALTWPVFDEMRSAWRGRIALQGVALFALDTVLDDPDQFAATVGTVSRYRGILGGVTFLGAAPDAKLDAALDALIAAAKAHDLDLDLHVDESAAPEARTLEAVADAVVRNKFAGKVLCGHCCSLALMGAADLSRVADKLAMARISVVSLPLCNLYLQDRHAGRTPRWRGVAPLHELAASGVDVMVASDNTRDPFYAYGDLDLLEVHREATRILHLDHPFGGSLRLVTSVPAAVMGLGATGHIASGAPADLIVLRARSLPDLLARPQADRVVLRAGRPINATVPDHRDLDALLA